jgi:hypothetical protein
MFNDTRESGRMSNVTRRNYFIMQNHVVKTLKLFCAVYIKIKKGGSITFLPEDFQILSYNM